MKQLDLVGHKFGKWDVIEKVPCINKHTAFLCKCECGTFRVLMGVELKRGKTNQCGCSWGSITTKMYRSHPLYDVWKGMKARCYGKNHMSYKNYGGKGVTVCEEWLKEFKPFYDWAMSNGYKEGLHLDKDIKANELGVKALLYSPQMCQFVTPMINHRNKPNLKINMDIAHEIRQSGMNIKELALRYNVHTTTIRRIIKSQSWY